MNWKQRLAVVTISVMAILSPLACSSIPASTTTTQNTVTTTAYVTKTVTQTDQGSGSLVNLDFDLADIIADIRPSIVAINTEVSYSSFFGTYTEEGAGSGWIIDSSGLIVTNNHVVEEATSVVVTMEDGQIFEAIGIYTDEYSDLAIIKIDAEGLPALQLGDSSSVRVGDTVIAMGNSLGMGISATSGIVSATDVTISLSGNQDMYDLIQTDAAINPGNSGGPLIDLAGQVIGINSVKVSDVGIEGMGYAISLEEALPILDQLIDNGYVSRPNLGANLYTVDQSIAQRYRLAVNYGALVTQVEQNGPADNAGIQAGDVIVALDDEEVDSSQELISLIYDLKVGQQVTVTVYRQHQEKTCTITLSES